MIAQLPPFRFTVDQYERMIETGILTEDDRVELLRGEIVPKVAIGDAHSACVDRLNWRLNRITGGQVLVRVQNPIVCVDSEPEPDISLVRFRPDFYETAKPRPADVELIVEVSDTSLAFDRDEKGPIYAENGIPEYWIIDLQSASVLVRRQPQADGTWAAVTTRHRGDTLDIITLPGVIIAVAEILP
jgi:Uma2 family endonuclease